MDTILHNHLFTLDSYEKTPFYYVTVNVDHSTAKCLNSAHFLYRRGRYNPMVHTDLESRFSIDVNFDRFNGQNPEEVNERQIKRFFRRIMCENCQMFDLASKTFWSLKQNPF